MVKVCPLILLRRKSLFLAPVLQAGLYERIYRDEKIVRSLISPTERSIDGFCMCFPLPGHLVKGLFDVILSNKLYSSCYSCHTVYITEHIG